MEQRQKQRTKASIQKTWIKNPSDTSKQWFLFDATGKTLGRLSTEISKILRGKHKPTYTPFGDCGDGVIIINAEKIKVSGSKEAQKVYRHYTGYIGGMREIPFRVMKDRKPEFILEHAVKGMVPRNTQGRAQMKRLRIYKGKGHQMNAQKTDNSKYLRGIDSGR